MTSVFHPLHRRAFLGRASLGLGAAALTTLGPDFRSASAEGKAPGWGKVKRVIFLTMSGGPSQFETFDHKPKLAEMDGEAMPESLTKGQQLAQLQGKELVCLGPKWPFRRCGKSGQNICDIVPHIQSIADDICIVRSMQSTEINHDPAHLVMNTGSNQRGRPSMGAWVQYGLGSEASDLPGYVVLQSVGGRNPQPIASHQWSAGILPAQLAGVELSARADAVPYLQSPDGVSRDRQRQVVTAVQKLDALEEQRTGDAALAARVKQYELAFAMQASVPELLDFSKESQKTKAAYGVTKPDGSFAANCLLARRLAERGVRFIQLYHRGWDHHGGLVKFMKVCTKLCDQPTAALINDLKARGLYDDTLIVWGGEFGRTPMAQPAKKHGIGRDHHIKAFSLFLSGGAVKNGFTYGKTDELGYDVVDKPIPVRNLHATILHLLGLDHEELLVERNGLDVSLTGPEEAHIVPELIA